MKPSLSDKMQQAKAAFFSYDFRVAYRIYQGCYSRLAFRWESGHWDHLSYFVRTLLELDKKEELRFYLPILQRHFQASKGRYVAYTLGYLHFVLGTEARRETRRLFEYAATSTDPDLCVKAHLMLARLCADGPQVIDQIARIDREPQDICLGQLLEVQRCIILRYQGQTDASIKRLNQLLAKLKTETDWYVQYSAADALFRGYLHLHRYQEASDLLSTLRQNAPKSRTCGTHLDNLQKAYMEFLGKESIQANKTPVTLKLFWEGRQITLRNMKLRRSFQLLARTNTLGKMKLAKRLRLSEPELSQTLDRLGRRLGELNLPVETLHREPKRIALVPQVVFCGGFR